MTTSLQMVFHEICTSKTTSPGLFYTPPQPALPWTCSLSYAQAAGRARYTSPPDGSGGVGSVKLEAVEGEW